ncbi:MAG TPA: type II and III secretion system protein family protein [Acidiphilium sp.]
MKRLAAFAFLLVLTTGMAVAAAPPSPESLTVEIGKGQVVRLDQAAQDIVVGDPAIADAKPLSSRLLWVFGKSVGETRIGIVGAGGSQVRTIDLSVTRGADAANTAVNEAMALKNAKAATLGYAGNQLTLGGKFDSLGPAMATAGAARSFVPKGKKLANLSKLAESPQITLSVKIAEVSRSRLKQLGINWQVLAHPGRFTASLVTGTFLGQLLGAVGGGSITGGYSSGPVTVNTLVQALEQHGALRMLAEPNLTTVSGEPANFLAGGQIPIPVPQSFGVTTITYKTYGVSLQFTPTLLPGDRIALHVAPEVSEISSANSVTIGGVSVPAFTTEEAETNVELASGQTVAIAGLFQSNQQNAINAVPGLGDLPVLGPFFKSTELQGNEDELVILITPYVTKPIGSPGATRVPTAGFGALKAALTGGQSDTAGVAAGFGIN